MKKTLFYLSMFCLVINSSSCEEDPPTIAEELSPLAIDLQNGYWETHFTSGAIMILSFTTTTSTSNWIEGTPPCIVDTSSQGYSLSGNLLTLETTGDGPLTVVIQSDTLTLEGDGFLTTFERKATLDYPDC